MDLKKVGRHLQKVREQKSLSFEQIYEATKIQPDILNQIEEGDSPLAPIFLKNFIKTYAQFLSVDITLFKEEVSENKPFYENQKTIYPLKAKANYFKKIKKFHVIFFSIAVIIFWGLSKPLFKQKPSLEVVENSTDHKLEPSAVVKKETYFIDQLKTQVFQQEILIRPLAEKLPIYFKTDHKALETKTLQAKQWYSIHATKEFYLRFDSQAHVEIFYNGQLSNFVSGFFEKAFKAEDFN